MKRTRSMERLRRWVFVIRPAVAVLAFLTVLARPPGAGLHAAERDEIKRPGNLILFIGDGMGVTHLTAGLVVNGGLNIQRLPVGGLLTTFPRDEFVTDSAASGTAMATGEKTANGAISVSSAGERLKTVFEYAGERGMATGLVVTCSVTHATPAVFVAHVRNRRNYFAIAEQIAGSGVDILFGGGRKYFIEPAGGGGAGKGGAAPLEMLRERTTVVESFEELKRVEGCRNITFLYAPGHPGKLHERGISLSDLTEQAVSRLSCREKGFALMVEGSQIDWGGHDRDEDYILAELLDFDRAVGVGLDFAEKDGNTLVIVTSDHETGGYALLGGSLDKRVITESSFATDQHTAAMVPVFSFGPGCLDFGGIHDNTYIGRKLIEYFKE